MNEKLDLTKILKDCPEGTKLYSPVYGDVELVKVQHDGWDYPIEVKLSKSTTGEFTKDGRLFLNYDGECMLFPSKEERDWSKFKVEKPKRPKFDPKTLQPFDKVLVRENLNAEWYCNVFSHCSSCGYAHVDGCSYDYCIPYNDDTKHLVGTNEEAPEFYRYWED